MPVLPKISARRVKKLNSLKVGLFLLLRAAAEFPPAQDAPPGDPGNHEIGELP